MELPTLSTAESSSWTSSSSSSSEEDDSPATFASVTARTTRRVACGNGYTLFLVDKEDAKDLPAFTPGPDQEPKPAVGAKTKAGAAKGGAAKKAKK